MVSYNCKFNVMKSLYLKRISGNSQNFPRNYKLAYLKIQTGITLLNDMIKSLEYELSSMYIEAQQGYKTFEIPYTETEYYTEVLTRYIDGVDSEGNPIQIPEQYSENRTREVTKYRSEVRYGLTDVIISSFYFRLIDVAREINSITTDEVTYYENTIEEIEKSLADIRNKIQEKARIEKKIKDLKLEKKNLKAFNPSTLVESFLKQLKPPNELCFNEINTLDFKYLSSNVPLLIEGIFRCLNFEESSFWKKKKKSYAKNHITEKEFYATF